MEDIDAGASNVPASISLLKERITSPTWCHLRVLATRSKIRYRTKIDKVIAIQKNMREITAETAVDEPALSRTLQNILRYTDLLSAAFSLMIF